jgi:hypothetical protein
MRAERLLIDGKPTEATRTCPTPTGDPTTVDSNTAGTDADSDPHEPLP